MPGKKQQSKEYLDKLALYEKLVATNPKIERKGDTMPYTSHNGNMFTLFDKSAMLAIRLPEEERENFIKKYKAKLHETYGTVMKEYVAVPDNLLGKTKELKKYFDISWEYVQSLKPKATAKKKK